MRELFIEWMKMDHRYNSKSFLNPVKKLDSLLASPLQDISPKHTAMATWMRANREECLQIITGIEGLT